MFQRGRYTTNQINIYIYIYIYLCISPFMAIDIVDLPIKSDDVASFFVCLPMV